MHGTIATSRLISRSISHRVALNYRERNKKSGQEELHAEEAFLSRYINLQVFSCDVGAPQGVQ